MRLASFLSRLNMFLTMAVIGGKSAGKSEQFYVLHPRNLRRRISPQNSPCMHDDKWPFTPNLFTNRGGLLERETMRRNVTQRVCTDVRMTRPDGVSVPQTSAIAYLRFSFIFILLFITMKCQTKLIYEYRVVTYPAKSCTITEVDEKRTEACKNCLLRRMSDVCQKDGFAIQEIKETTNRCLSATPSVKQLQLKPLKG